MLEILKQHKKKMARMKVEGMQDASTPRDLILQNASKIKNHNVIKLLQINHVF
jgi:hypothetical protein